MSLKEYLVVAGETVVVFAGVALLMFAYAVFEGILQ